MPAASEHFKNRARNARSESWPGRWKHRRAGGASAVDFINFSWVEKTLIVSRHKEQNIIIQGKVFLIDKDRSMIMIDTKTGVRRLVVYSPGNEVLVWKQRQRQRELDPPGAGIPVHLVQWQV
jgi:hypothetical protein